MILHLLTMKTSFLCFSVPDLHRTSNHFKRFPPFQPHILPYCPQRIGSVFLLIIVTRHCATRDAYSPPACLFVSIMPRSVSQRRGQISPSGSRLPVAWGKPSALTANIQSSLLVRKQKAFKGRSFVNIHFLWSENYIPKLVSTCPCYEWMPVYGN